MKVDQYTVGLITSFYYILLKEYTTNLHKVMMQGLYVLPLAI